MCARMEVGGMVARRTRKGLTAELDFEQGPKAVQEEGKWPALAAARKPLWPGHSR